MLESLQLDTVWQINFHKSWIQEVSQLFHPAGYDLTMTVWCRVAFIAARAHCILLCGPLRCFFYFIFFLQSCSLVSQWVASKCCRDQGLVSSYVRDFFPPDELNEDSVSLTSWPVYGTPELKAHLSVPWLLPFIWCCLWTCMYSVPYNIFIKDY